MIDSIRDYVSALFRHIGRYLMLMVEAFRSPIYDGPTYRQNLARQMMRVGVESLPIVAIAAAFTGGVTTEQTIYQMRYHVGLRQRGPAPSDAYRQAGGGD
jgi:phospholipid/cholesterol/gamma-HCH transport system permease protein